MRKYIYCSVNYVNYVNYNKKNGYVNYKIQNCVY